MCIIRGGNSQTLTKDLLTKKLLALRSELFVKEYGNNFLKTCKEKDATLQVRRK